jgi:hypothetical protein
MAEKGFLMSPARNPRRELEARLERLVLDYSREPGDRLSATDERAFFGAVDEATKDGSISREGLERLGALYAQKFIVPYLRGKDAVDLISEIAALIEIHHRGTLRLYDFNETSDGAEMVVTFDRINMSGRRRSPTPFDFAVVRTALGSRFAGVDITGMPSRGLIGEQLHIRLSVDAPVIARAEESRLQDA